MERSGIERSMAVAGLIFALTAHDDAWAQAQKTSKTADSTPAGAAKGLVPSRYVRPYVIRAETSASPILLPEDLRQPAGAAWDGEYLWVTDASRPTIWRIDPADPESRRIISLPGVFTPGAIAIDRGARAAWVVQIPQPKASGARPPREDSSSEGSSGDPAGFERPVVAKYDLTEGKLITALPVTPLAEPGPVTGLAVDGGRLWLSAGSGLCACVYLVDPDDDGRVLTRFFPRCNPVAMTVDESTAGTPRRRVLLAAERVAKEPVLLERLVMIENGTGKETVQTAHRTQRFFMLETGVRPGAIAVVGTELWVLDVPEPGTAEPGVVRRYRMR